MQMKILLVHSWPPRALLVFSFMSLIRSVIATSMFLGLRSLRSHRYFSLLLELSNIVPFLTASTTFPGGNRGRLFHPPPPPLLLLPRLEHKQASTSNHLAPFSALQLNCQTSGPAIGYSKLPSCILWSCQCQLPLDLPSSAMTTTS
ncbi:hypothetical protein QBC45DRAFT_425479 [Copromyces sp. CBS 386.78]|nr:hypothetical protein QBC45DRAFT_425479 [Copromyces sp. CBS 386.78]